MVLPDGTRSERQRPTPSRGAVAIIALVGLVGGTLAIGALTSPDPEPEAFVAPTSTTSTTIEELERPLDLENFSVDQIAIGEPLEWERAVGIDDLYARKVVLHEDVLYLFGSDQEPWAWVPNPVVVWRSTNGRDWESLGAVLETEGPIRQVASTPQGLMVVESGHEGLTIWRSQDAIGWESELIPLPEVSEHRVVYPTAVAASAEAVAVIGSVQTDVGRLLNERLLDIGTDLDLTKYGWGYDSVAGEIRFVVQGPMGIHLLEVTADELGLSAEQVELFTTGDDVAETILWVQDENTWRHAVIEDVGWVDSLTFDGSRLLAFGYDETGAGIWIYEDGGLHWSEDEVAVGQPWSVLPWLDGFVGLHEGPVVDIATSEDGLTWERAGLNEYFPSQLGWSPSALAVGPTGVALVAEGWNYADGPTSTNPEPSVLTRDGATLSLDPNLGEIELAVGGHVQMWRMYSDQNQEGIEVDLETKQVSFHDLETGETLAAFTIDELMEAERSNGFQFPHEQSFQAFLYSPDAETWTIEDLEDDFGDGIRVMSLAVTEDAVVALVGSWNYFYGTEPGLEIWTGQVP